MQNMGLSLLRATLRDYGLYLISQGETPAASDRLGVCRRRYIRFRLMLLGSRLKKT